MDDRAIIYGLQLVLGHIQALCERSLDEPGQALDLEEFDHLIRLLEILRAQLVPF